MIARKRPHQTTTSTRPQPVGALDRAKRIADDREGLREQELWERSVLARFSDADENAVIAMWERGTNEKSDPLSKFELQALVERWCQLFGFLPPSDGVAAGKVADHEPQDDTMLNIREVERLTGLSESTIERRIRKGVFPAPVKLSARRIGWPAREVKAWRDQLDANRGRSG